MFLYRIRDEIKRQYLFYSDDDEDDEDEDEDGDLGDLVDFDDFDFDLDFFFDFLLDSLDDLSIRLAIFLSRLRSTFFSFLDNALNMSKLTPSSSSSSSWSDSLCFDILMSLSTDLSASGLISSPSAFSPSASSCSSSLALNIYKKY